MGYERNIARMPSAPCEVGAERDESEDCMPGVLDLVLFLDLAQRSGMCGVQDGLSFGCKSPMRAPDL